MLHASRYDARIIFFCILYGLDISLRNNHRNYYTKTDKDLSKPDNIIVMIFGDLSIILCFKSQTASHCASM